MAFESGHYFIRSTESGKLIGRHLVEDRSLLPKRVLSLPSSEAGQARFLVEKQDDDSYIIKVQGAKIISYNNHLYAALLSEPFPNQKWKFEPISGSDNVSIVDADGDADKTWTVKDNEDYAQVETGSGGESSWTLVKMGEEDD